MVRVPRYEAITRRMILAEFYEAAGAAVVAMDAILTPQLQDALKADHISYKCGSRQSFEHLRGLFESSGAKFWNASISGRSISYIFLLKPIKTSVGDVRFLELSDQKPDNSQQDGFDHIEVYPSFEALCTRDEIVRMLSNLGYGEARLSNRPHHQTNDLVIDEEGLELRLEQEPLVWTIVRRELQ